MGHGVRSIFGAFMVVEFVLAGTSITGTYQRSYWLAVCFCEDEDI